MNAVTLPPSGHAVWDELATWWLSRYKPSTQRTYATYLPCWNRWCAGRRIDPLAARRADVELWLRTVADSRVSRASVAAHYDAVASLYRAPGDAASLTSSVRAMDPRDGDVDVPGGGGDPDAPFPPLDGVRHQFVELPGLRMHVAEAGTGEPLVLLHGFPQHWWGWRKVLPALAAHHRVVAPDLRGAGWTDAPPHGYTEDQLVADVVALLDALELDRVCLAGLDIGGILGFRICLAHPERVSRFVCLGAPHPYPVFSAGVLRELWRMWPSFATALPVLGPSLLSRGQQRIPRRMMVGDTTDPDVWSAEDLELFLVRLREPSRARAAAALYRALAMGSARRAAAGAYRGTRLVTPTLSLYGTVLYAGNRDAAGHPGILHGYEPYADDVTLAHVSGSGYYLAEEQPDAVVRHVLDFLAAP